MKKAPGFNLISGSASVRSVSPQGPVETGKVKTSLECKRPSVLSRAALSFSRVSRGAGLRGFFFQTLKTIPIKKLRELLDYNPETGTTIWKTRSRKWFTSDVSMRTWNSRFAGKVAGTLSVKGYRCFHITRQVIMGHRVVWAMFHGKWPKNELDHVNGVRDDNRISNLREATSSENRCNSKKLPRNTSGIKGVSWCKRGRNWVTYVNYKGKAYRLGRFNDKQAASKAVEAKRAEIHGAFANNG